MWVVVEVERSRRRGCGDESTVEAGVRLGAAIAGRAIAENRSLGVTASAGHVTTLPADRGPRQRQKLMQLLAVVDGDGGEPLVEILVQFLPRLRRGTTAVIITPSLDRGWIRPLAGLRARGVGCVVCLVDPGAYEAYGNGVAGGAAEQRARDRRAVLHALAEHDIPVHVIVPGRPLGELLVSPGRAVAGGVR